MNPSLCALRHLLVTQYKTFFLHLPKKMEPIEGSETSAFKPQTPGTYPKENILQYKTSLRTNLLAVIIKQIKTENNTHSHAQDTTAFLTTVS